jgi:hypothetical protein
LFEPFNITLTDLIILNNFQNFVFVPLIYFLFPETAGLSLEEIDYLFVERESAEILEAGTSAAGSSSRSEDKDGIESTSENNGVKVIKANHDKRSSMEKGAEHSE